MEFKPTTQKKKVYKIKHCIQHSPVQRQANLILRSRGGRRGTVKVSFCKSGSIEDTGNA